jgi:predicted transport protein
LFEAVNSLSVQGFNVTAVPFETYICQDKSILHKFTTFTKEALEQEAKKWSFKWTTVPIENHLNKANKDVQEVLKELSERICCIGPDVKEVPRKAWMTYQTAPLKNFCTVKIMKDALEVNIKADGTFSDKKRIAKGITRTPAWTFDKVFQVRSKDELDYAIFLIKQAYKCMCG